MGCQKIYGLLENNAMALTGNDQGFARLTIDEWVKNTMTKKEVFKIWR